MRITADWHIHSRNSACGHREASLCLIAEGAQAAGLEAFGIADHLHCPLSIPLLRVSRAEFDALSEPRMHFGVEATCLRVWDLEVNEALGKDGVSWGIHEGGPEDSPLVLPLSEELIEELGIEYVIGGVHRPLGAPYERHALIRDYHRQYMFLSTHPCVDIVAHPWWWGGSFKDAGGCYHGLPWLDDFRVVPEAFHREFGESCRENGVAVEINACGIFLNGKYSDGFRAQYVSYLKILKEAGVRFSIGSDSHQRGYIPLLGPLEAVLESVGIAPEELWHPGLTG